MHDVMRMRNNKGQHAVDEPHVESIDLWCDGQIVVARYILLLTGLRQAQSILVVEPHSFHSGNG